jgi:PhnB protein
MATTMAPYIGFYGRTRDALTFYDRCFSGATIVLQTFAEAGIPPMRPGGEQDVMHAEFRAGGIVFFATDCGEGEPVDGNRISLSINLDDEAEQTRMFEALCADGGSVAMPLELMFWGARFGMLKDRFGIHWMLNCQKQ